jgi:hypothetical protein
MLTGTISASGAGIVGTGEVVAATLADDGSVTLTIRYQCPTELDGHISTSDSLDTLLQQRRGKFKAMQQGGGIGAVHCTGEPEVTTTAPFTSETDRPFRPGRAYFGVTYYKVNEDDTFGAPGLQITDDHVVIKPSR